MSNGRKLCEDEIFGDDLMEKAKKMENISGLKRFFHQIFGFFNIYFIIYYYVRSDPSYIDVQDLYLNASIHYQKAQAWKKGADALENAARVNRYRLNKKNYAFSLQAQAGSMYQKFDLDKAIECFKMGVSNSLNAGDLSTAANYCIEIAQLYLYDLNNRSIAITYYNNAFEYYKGCNLKKKARSCQLKVAELKIEIDDFQGASIILEKLVNLCIPMKRGKGGELLNYFKKCVLSVLCSDVMRAEKLISTLSSKEPFIRNSEERKFLCSINEAIQENKDAIDTVKDEYKKKIILDEIDKKLLKNLMFVGTLMLSYY